MKAYVYLESQLFVDTWVKGGELPIASVLKYVCQEDERGMNLTPDEGLIDNSTHDLSRYGVQVTNSKVHFTDCQFDDLRIPKAIVERFDEKGIVLCASTTLDSSIAKGFKRDYCVRIDSFRTFQNTINKLVGQVGVFGFCEYTNDHRRNCFLKSEKDSWQKEVRIFWKNLEPMKVILPTGLATQVAIPKR